MAKLENLKEIFFLFAKDGSDGLGINFDRLKYVAKEYELDIKDNELEMLFEKEFVVEEDENAETEQPKIDLKENALNFDQFYHLMTEIMKH